MNVRKLAAVAIAAGAVFGPVVLAAPAEAGVAGCTLNVLNVPPRDSVNCYTDTAGFCVFYYDPVENFPSGTLGETTTFVSCLAL